MQAGPAAFSPQHSSLYPGSLYFPVVLDFLVHVIAILAGCTYLLENSPGVPMENPPSLVRVGAFRIPPALAVCLRVQCL